MKTTILLFALILLFTSHTANACSCSACSCSGYTPCPVPLKTSDRHVRNLTCPTGSHFSFLRLYIDSPSQNSSFYYSTYSEVEYNKYVSGKSASSIYSPFIQVACYGSEANKDNISPFSKLFMVITCETEEGCLAKYSLSQSCSPDYSFTAKLAKVSYSSGEEFSLDVTFPNINYSMPVTLSLDDPSVSLNGVTTRQLSVGKVTFTGLSFKSPTSKSSVYIVVKGNYFETEIVGGISASIEGGSVQGSTGRQNLTVSQSCSLVLVIFLIISTLLMV